MSEPSLVGPAVVAACVSACVTTIGFWVNRSTSLKMHTQKLDADRDLAERKVNADIALADRKFEFDKKLAEHKVEFDITLAERKFQLDAKMAERKKRQELAEEVLSGFYQVADIVRAVRSPFSYGGEAKDRPKSEGESESTAHQRDTFYAIIARFEARRQEISDLVARRYRMVAWFGKAAEEPFNQLQEALNTILISAQMLVRWSGDHPSVAQSDPDLWRKLEGDIWWTGDGSDPIAAKIAIATRQMEELCRPILESSST